MKVNWWAVALFAAAIAWGFREGCACVKKKEAPSILRVPQYLPGRETVIIDTVYIPKPYEVVQYRVSTPVTGAVTKTDTVEVPVIVEVSEGTAYYRDSLPVAHGYAIIQDTVYENRISGRGFRINQALPVVKETVTIQAKPKNIWFLGFEGAGSKQHYLYSGEIDISLKTKKDRMYTIGAGLTVDNQVLYKGGFKVPIRF